ncbi:DNA polymerase III subunit chi [Methyloligella halotolerans]|uniref:DNA polymerase III subunit chi n=1 Tax=Methyloligella halotolerans TaxID=1177755 RepID=A0A1E2RWM4_9HYPH|nr:DNA polymerase III subunit chi [Methyloligella halotolerans]ODA66469.1 DNA polymerase III subunit chi [Methyloligella halotolerans]
MSAAATELYFYHLEQRSLEDVLPVLLERSLERGWRAVVQAGSEERLEQLNSHLWTYSQASFLPHGTEEDGPPAEQPVFLTLDDGNPNGAAIRFLVDGAPLSETAGYERIVILFDGRDEDAKARARQEWKAARDKDIPVSYWQQDETGRWQQKA